MPSSPWTPAPSETCGHWRWATWCQANRRGVFWRWVTRRWAIRRWATWRWAAVHTDTRRPGRTHCPLWGAGRAIGPPPFSRSPSPFLPKSAPFPAEVRRVLRRSPSSCNGRGSRREDVSGAGGVLPMRVRVVGSGSCGRGSPSSKGQIPSKATRSAGATGRPGNPLPWARAHEPTSPVRRDPGSSVPRKLRDRSGDGPADQRSKAHCPRSGAHRDLRFCTTCRGRPIRSPKAQQARGES